MLSSESDSGSEPKCKRNANRDSSSDEPRRVLNIRKRNNFRLDSSSDSDSDSSFEKVVLRRKKPRVVDSDSVSSDSDIIRVPKKKNVNKIVDDEDSGRSSSSSSWSSDSESNNELSNRQASKNNENAVCSDASDGKVEKCPICLLSFKDQEIGSPETCDHVFCAGCIEEWSKNVNTCPVDRLPFGIILVRNRLDGHVIRQIVVEAARNHLEVSLDNLDVVVDNWVCEICGSDQNGDTMLLCDGCDLGFHMVCLEPPLEEIPEGEWYCPTCQTFGMGFSLNVQDSVNYIMNAVVNNGEGSTRRRRRTNLRGRNGSSRLLPRTRQNERIIMSIRRRRVGVITEEESTNGRESSLPRREKARKKRKKKSKRKHRQQKRVEKLKRNVKARLAAQLGIRRRQRPNQNTPDVNNVVNHNNNPIGNISIQRNMAGIPRLHLFGRRDELDYFSPSDSENNDFYSSSTAATESNGCLLLTAAPQNGARRRTTLKMKGGSLGTSVDVLGSILDSQTKFHSKNYTLSVVGNSGNIKLDLKNCDFKIRQNSLVSESDSTTPSSTNTSADNSNGNVAANEGSNTGERSGRTASTSGGSGPLYSDFGGNDDTNQNPIDYSLPPPPLPPPSLLQSFYEKEKKKDFYNPEEMANSPTSDSELDIYSDIETTVSTSRGSEETIVQQQHQRPSETVDENVADNNESDVDLVIDDTDKEKYDPACVFDSDEDDEDKEKIEEEPPAVSSTVGGSDSCIVATSETSNVVNLKNAEIQSNTVQSSSSSLSNNHATTNRDLLLMKDSDEDEDEEMEDDCPNFSIYSTESINMAKSTDIAMMGESARKSQEKEKEEAENKEVVVVPSLSAKKKKPESANNALYSDSEDENVVKIVDRKKPFGITDLQTEDISEEERSYTPCLDEKDPQQQRQQSLGCLDTEMISDDDKNDFDDANDLKTTSDGDALEINAKESELDFTTRTEECEEGEIVDKKTKKTEDEEEEDARRKMDNEDDDDSNKENEKQKENENSGKKDITSSAAGAATGEVATAATFKRISKSNRERNYRENRSRSRSKSRDGGRQKKNKTGTAFGGESERDRKEQRRRRRVRKEIQIYNVRSIVSDKPRRVKDQFGRDIATRRVSDTDSSRSLTPPPQSPAPRRNYRDSSPSNVVVSSSSLRQLATAASRSRSRSSFHTPTRQRRSSRSFSPAAVAPLRRSPSPRNGRRGRSKEKKKRKRNNRSSRSASPREQQQQQQQRRRRSYSRRRKKSSNRSRSNKEKKRRKSRDRSKTKNKKARSRSRKRQRSASPPPTSPSPLRRRDWERKNWTPSLSPSSPPSFRHMSPSWTPPRLLNQPPVKPQNLTVILTNDSSKKTKKDKKKKSEKRTKESGGDKVLSKKRSRRDKSPAPSKEVFASGNNILVSVSFNKDAENTRDVLRKRYESTTELTTKRLRKEREKRNDSNTMTTTTNTTIANSKTTSNSRCEKNDRRQKLVNVKPVAIIDLELSPFRELTPSPQDIIVLTDSENGDSNDITMKNKNASSSSQQISSPQPPAIINTYNSAGPKTPPEPQVKFSLSSKQSQMRPIVNPLHEPDDVDDEDAIHEEEEEQVMMHKGPNTPPEPPNSPPSSPDAYDPFDPTKSRTPTPEPSSETSTHKLQSSNTCLLQEHEETNTDDADKVPTGGGSGTLTTITIATPPDVRPADSQSSIMIPSTPEVNTSPERPISVIINQVVQSQTPSQQQQQQQQPLTVVAPSSMMITSTPVSAPRINILNSTILTATSNVSSSSIISSQAQNKVSPTKMSNVKISGGVGGNVATTSAMQPAVNLDFDSPYSPGSSDYDDLFEPPPETGAKTGAKTSKAATTATISGSSTNTNKTAPSKSQASAFDQLFGSSPQQLYKIKSKPNKSNIPKPKPPHKSTSKVKSLPTNSKGTKLVGVKLDEDNLKILDELPSSAVEMQVKDKFLKKLNRQERVVEEVKLVLKPHYNKKHVTKEEYKDILRRAVPKICHNKSGEINPKKIQALIEAYVRKVRHSKKVTSSSSINPQKTEVISNWLSKIN